MPPFYITTSWDDGHPLDLRIADLLTRFGLTGTFYIARDYLDQRLTEAQIAALANQHEIGAHTLTHPRLTHIDAAHCRHEVSGSRIWLQQVTGQPIPAFCYPRGAHDAQVRRIVAEAGFALGRTVEAYAFDPGADPFAVPTTLQIYPFPLRPVDSVSARFDRLRQVAPQLPRLKVPPWALRSWPTFALALLDRAARTGGVWHLWGHSWEIERYGMWDALEHVLAAASAYPSARPIVNGRLLDRDLREAPRSLNPV